MNHLVRIISDDDGEEQDNKNDWHLVDPGNQCGPATLCTGEFFGEGESNWVFKTKQQLKGGVTCPECIKKIKIYQGVKL